VAIKVGCCGWGFFPGGLKAYAGKFSLVEVQQTFYKLPMLKTAQRWRAEVPGDFEFTLKAWQVITHPPTSPTWRRAGLKLTEAQRERYGWLRPTQENFEAWRRTREIAEALGAKICLIQCPPNFNCTSENIENMRRFLSEIDRGNLTIAWEPRGDWKEHPDEVSALCEELGLIHVVDPMRRESVSKQEIAYFRLHGLNPREYDYRYKYSLSELKRLAAKMKELSRRHREVYVMFNNTEMYLNAAQLQKMLAKKK
jgi:uncharacterized protein YecE (DUF72 family)